MQWLDFQQLQTYPSLQMLIGTSQSQQILDEVNAKWGGNATVSFGLASNPMNDHYNHFMGVVQDQLEKTDKIISEVTQTLMYPDHWRVIDNEAALQVAPICMQPALLMTPVVFQLFQDQKISGWGWDPSTFPEEDVYGKQLNNGKVVLDPRDPSTKVEYVETEWNSAEAEFFEMTDEQKEILEKSREFITDWIEQEMSEDGLNRDLTDLDNTISI